jgi:gliding motility-associated-like protein
MTGRILSHSKRLLFCLLILVGFSSALLSVQSKVHGVINKYGRVTGIGTDYVILNDPVQFSQFSAGDTVLLIQMKGGQEDTPESSSFGTLHTYIGSPGKYEFLIVLSVYPGLKEIEFRNDLVNSYDINGDVQIIKVPSYNSAVVDAPLTCAPWDSTGKVGGVLALIVGRTISLNANIDVTGNGFTGGGTVIGDGICVGSNSARFDKYAFPKDSTNSGFKGESLVSQAWIDLSTQISLLPLYAKGKGANFNGGGGGNGNFSGGGGGSNYGAGGKGGRENIICFPTYILSDGGIGGKQIKFILDGGIFLGGGGGSSTYYAGSTPSAGANGGGMVIIVCDTLIGNGKIVRADGNGAGPASGNAGSGGGGGAGSIALYLQSFTTSTITLTANGGKGGDDAGQFGEGGGGGGGLIWVNNISIPGNVNQTVTGGAVGARTGGSTGGNGNPGENLTTFVPLLNGFLFNSIRSSVTGDQVDSICSNMIPRPITGTNPVGGSGNYTYLWQKSYNLAGLPANIPASNSLDFIPSATETNTVFFRRVVTDNVTSLTDTSKWVKIIVQPFIKNNIVGSSDTICFAQNQTGFTSMAALQDGNGIYAFKWQVSLDSNLFSLPGNTYNLEGYTPPPALTATSWYRRTITSGRCIDSSAIVKTTVLPNIINNTITSPPDSICYGMVFPNISSTRPPVLSGGDNTYRFNWESNINSSGWGDAPGERDTAGYNPVELPQKVPYNDYFYRRVVKSGAHDVCVNTSAPVHLKDFPVIANNTISGDQTIGHDSIPSTLIGLSPINGNGYYSFLWQYKTKIQSWATANGINSLQNYSPSALTDTTWYRRVVNSAACSDTSNVIVVNVHKTIINNTISFVSGLVEDTICNGSTPAILKGALPAGGSDIPGDYAFQWYYSLNNIAWNPVVAAGTSQDYQPGALSVTTYFRRNVGSPIVSPTSISKSNAIKITVLPLISNKDIAADQNVCKGSPIAPITGVSGSPSGGDNSYRYTWRQDSAGTGWTNITGYIKTASASYSKSSVSDPFMYKRYVYSGSNDCCADSSNAVSIGINQLPTGAITSISDTTVCEGSPVPLKIHLTGASKWKVIYTENSTQITLNNVMASDTILLLEPSTTNSSAIFNYALFSVQDNNLCNAASLTGTRKNTIYKVPNPFAGNDVAVCGPRYNLITTSGVGTGRWYYPAGVVDTTINAPSVTVTVDSTTAAWETKYTFLWKEANWLCTGKDSVVITFDKRIGLVSAGPDRSIFSLDKIDTLRAIKPLVGTGVWSEISGGGTISNDSIANNLSVGPNEFEWTVTNGACISKDQVVITVSDLKIPNGFSPNGDGINDEFEIEGLNLDYYEATLRILNSAGTEVFFTSNANGSTWSNWKGENSNGILPEGTYYYLLTIKSKRNNDLLKKGGFVLLKRIKSQ